VGQEWEAAHAEPGAVLRLCCPLLCGKGPGTPPSVAGSCHCRTVSSYCSVRVLCVLFLSLVPCFLLTHLYVQVHSVAY